MYGEGNWVYTGNAEYGEPLSLSPPSRAARRANQEPTFFGISKDDGSCVHGGPKHRFQRGKLTLPSLACAAPLDPQYAPHPHAHPHPHAVHGYQAVPQQQTRYGTA